VKRKPLLIDTAYFLAACPSDERQEWRAFVKRMNPKATDADADQLWRELMAAKAQGKRRRNIH